MNLPAFSVHRPVFTTMLTLIVIILGLVSLSRLRIDMLPNVELPTLTITTGYEGASPVVMERLITQIIEEIIATVPGVEEIASSSSEGRSQVTVRFSWGVDIDTAAIDVQSQLADEISELPDDIVRPRVSKFDVASYPVVIMGISSPMDPVELTRIIEEQLRYRFARIPGVAQVDTWGAFNREVRIELDPDRIKALGLPFNLILGAVQAGNVDLPTGKINQGRYEVTLRAPAEFIDVEQIRNVVVMKRGDAYITLSQIADIRDTYERQERLIRVNQDLGLRIAIRKQADANTVEVARLVLEEIEEANRDYPQVRIIPVINQGNLIQRSIENVAQSVVYGGGLAVLVLLFFLRNIRSTVVIALSIPISIIATFALIYFGGFTINLMTLGGLALGVGMMVDSSVVVLENIFRRQDEMGEPVAGAAVEGAREVGGAIFASTVTTLVIFLPLVFVRGVAGVLFQELAYVVMFSLACSLLVSLSLVPMLSAKILRSPEARHGDRPAWLDRLASRSDEQFRRLDAGYAALLRWSLRHRVAVVMIAAGALGLSLLLLPHIGTEFLPPSDEGEVQVSGEMEVGTRLDLVDRQTRRMEAAVYPAVPEMVSSVTTMTSSGGRSPDARGEIRLSLSPAARRDRSNQDIADDLRRRLEGRIPGMKIRTRAPQGQFLLERILGSGEGLRVEVRGFDFDVLDQLTARAAAAVEAINGVTDVEISRKGGIPELEVQIDRDKVADLGLTPRDVAQVLETAIAGTKAGEYRAGGQSYRILVQLADAENRSIDEVLSLVLATPDGEQVALRNLVDVRESKGPVTIERLDQQRIVKIDANVAGRDTGSVAADIQQALAGIVVPEGYELRVTGTYEEQKKASRELTTSLILALVLVYMVLACQYESLRDPVVVMASVPLAAIGVFVILFLTGTTLNLQSYIGCIMLGGIVVNNAILLVDQSAALQRQGLAVFDAVAEAGRRRLRPILMTSLTTILALMPLALGVGEGSEAQAPLARAVVGGLSASTLITLVLIPVVFSLVHPDREGRAGEAAARR